MNLMEAMEAMANAKSRMNGNHTNLEHFRMTGILNMTEYAEDKFGWLPDEMFDKEIKS